jgi:DNA-binding transcriptional LysR family regulator
MKRELRSAGKFDRKLATLFEALEGREKELQSRLDELVKGLLDGGIGKAPVHHPTDDTCCLPLIDNYVVVFRADQASAAGRDKAGRNLLDFSIATTFDLLNIEQEDDD